jgi:hypothetical protein
MTTAPRATTPGPQVGIPPSLEQVPVTRLSVDPTYQRATDSEASRRIILGMVKQWNWTLCQPLVVARRTDGSLWVLDGQHRLAGAIERGDIPYVPCVISSSLDHTEEARTFVELNTRRQKLTQSQIFHGMLAAGDPDAKQVQLLLDETGWRVRRTTNTAIYGPGDLECAPMLTRMLAQRGEGTVRFALTVLRAAYPETAVRQSATFLKAVAELFDQVDGTSLTARKIIDTIGAAPPHKWTARAVALQESNRNLSLITAIARAMLAAAQGKPVPPAERPVTAVAPPPAITALPIQAPRRTTYTPDTRVFGTSGKGWCEQCEQLCSREAAAACVARHCKLRAHT